jgi:hypothetical protein
MLARLTGAAAGLALGLLMALAPPVGAQDPLPTPSASPTPSATATPTPSATPTPTATPTPEEQKRAERDKRDRKAKTVRRIYRDFERDGRIDDCDHTVTALKRARRSISDSYAEDYPDFRDALTAAIERHDDGKCVEAQPPTDAPTPAPTAAPGVTGTTPAAPAPTAPPYVPPSSSPESGNLPDFGAGGGSGGSGGTGGSGAEPGTIPAPGEDAIPEGTPSPSPTPAPAALPPKLIVTRAATDTNLFVPGTLLAIALLGLLAAGGSALVAKRTGRFQGVGHAWQEAAWRASGTWNEFGDWLRRR